MRTFLFLDDWMIDATRDVVRRWPQATPADAPTFVEANNYAWIMFDPRLGRYRCWYDRYCPGRVPDEANEGWLDAPFIKGTFYAESDDGLTFQPVAHGGPLDLRFPDSDNGILLPQRVGNPHKVQGFHRVLLDEREPDESMRYKTPSVDGPIFTSPDGITWTPQPQMQWLRPALDSDTFISMLHNPVTDCYQFFCRPGNLDRRVATIESKDLKTFSDRRVIIQPDALDPPLLQFYGMIPFWYEDMFIGLLWDNFIPNLEVTCAGNLQGVVKMCGIVDTSLVYSYDGRCWLRGPRTPLLPKAPMPQFGWAGHYATSIVVGPDGVMRIYSRANRLEHGEFDLQREFFNKGEGDGALRVYTMRKDGFAYLEPVGSFAWLRTRGLIPQDAELTVNFQAPLGKVLVQVADESGTAYPGFSFDDCVPLTGDDVAGRPTWKEKSLQELVGKFVRLEFKFYQAYLYAYRWNCKLHYALNPQERI